MTLKPVTLQLDESEYKKLEKYLEEFDDPDITIEIVIRSYVRNLYRTMPLVLRSNYDIKNYFRMLSTWFKYFEFMVDNEIVSKIIGTPQYYRQWTQDFFYFETKKTGEGVFASQTRH